jgi:hypothetical protein
MILFYLADTIVSFNWHFFNVNIYDYCMLLKLLWCKVLASITNYNIRGVLIYINPTDLQCVLSGLYTYIVKKLGCLEHSCFINNIKDWFTIKIHDINNNTPVEFIVILKGKFESAGSLGIHLILIAVFC